MLHCEDRRSAVNKEICSNPVKAGVRAKHDLPDLLSSALVVILRASPWFHVLQPVTQSLPVAHVDPLTSLMPCQLFALCGFPCLRDDGVVETSLLSFLSVMSVGSPCIFSCILC